MLNPTHQKVSRKIPGRAHAGYIRQLQSRAKFRYAPATLRQILAGKLPVPKDEPAIAAYINTLNAGGASHA